MRLPITIRSRGNWSVLYVRIVCVTTLPKCFVHMVSSLEDNKIMQLSSIFILFNLIIHLFLKKTNTSEPVTKENTHKSNTKMHIYKYTYKHFYKMWKMRRLLFSNCSSKEKYTQFVALRTMLLFLIPSEWHAISIGAIDKLVFLTRHPELIGQERIFYSITKTELFKLTFQRGKRVAGSRGPAKLPVNVIILMNCYRLNANID